MELEEKKEVETLTVDTTTVKETVLALKGFLMGSADVVPGVSGGTMALILDIYERFLHAIKSVNATFIKGGLTFKWKEAVKEIHWLFLIPLFAGILSADAFSLQLFLCIYVFTLTDYCNDF